jgi:hypothetical protein
MTRASLRPVGRRAIAVLIDTVLWIAAVIIVTVILTGGGRIELGGVDLRVRSIGNVVLVWGALMAVRWWLSDVPILACGGITPEGLADRSAAVLTRLRAYLDGGNGRAFTRWLLVAAAAATAIRIANALVYHGFITGDDVEIHEMSLGLALGRAWPVWDLRNAFYPVGFIYPVQKVLVSAGLTDIFSLVFAGRTMVMAAAALNIYLVYRVGTALFAHRGQGLVASLLFAFNHLHMGYGSAELPRVVATSFLLGAFWISLRPTVVRACAAGALVGVGAALRFGEVVFLVPAVVASMAYANGAARDLGGRLLRTALLAVASVATTLLIVGIADALYWGEAFHSLRAIVDYTLVKRLSSRGYEAPWYYLTHVPDWSNVALVFLAGLSARRGGGRALTWAVLPIVVLSVLPHKEPRYVIATIPFWSLAAARGAWLWLERIAAGATAKQASGLALIAIVIGSSLFDASRFRFRRSEDTVRLGWTLAESGAKGLAADQLWRFGGRLYLDALEPLVDLDPARAADERESQATFCRVDLAYVALRTELITAERARALDRCGFRDRRTDPAAGYTVFRRDPRQAP